MGRIDDFAATVAEAATQPVADVRRIFANAVKTQEPFESDRFGISSPAMKALRNAACARRQGPAQHRFAVRRARGRGAESRRAGANAVVALHQALELTTDVLAVRALYGGSEPLDFLDGNAAALAPLRERAKARHGLPAPEPLDPTPGWDGGAKEKAQASTALAAAPSLVPELATVLFAQSWAQDRTPGLWLAFAAHLEDHVAKGEGKRLAASAREGVTKRVTAARRG